MSTNSANSQMEEAAAAISPAPPPYSVSLTLKEFYALRIILQLQVQTCFFNITCRSGGSQLHSLSTKLESRRVSNLCHATIFFRFTSSTLQKYRRFFTSCLVTHASKNVNF